MQFQFDCHRSWKGHNSLAVEKADDGVEVEARASMECQ
ncbi:unnamed protein product [Linum tenue]|uniref:Uncharacterized protein n=1 Tax=Linum tenue TaxID=586396 RepID=A0AAV0L995_9ROSI|nr:unnamed protein product [Linum tenue]